MNITKFIGNYTFIKENNQSVLYKIIKPTDKPISLRGELKTDQHWHLSRKRASTPLIRREPFCVLSS